MKRSPLPRTQMRRRYRDTGPDAKTVALVDGRNCGMCELCNGEVARHTHHRVPRGAGGTSDPRINLPSNLLRLCPACHEYVERNRAEALIAGWLVSRWSDPAQVAVLIQHGSRWTYLGADGRYHDNPPEVAA